MDRIHRRARPTTMHRLFNIPLLSKIALQHNTIAYRTLLFSSDNTETREETSCIRDAVQ